MADERIETKKRRENVTIQPLKKYVVFESAYAAGGEDENATQENPITHKDVNDKAQTIVTEGENEKILDDVEVLRVLEIAKKKIQIDQRDLPTHLIKKKN